MQKKTKIIVSVLLVVFTGIFIFVLHNGGVRKKNFVKSIWARSEKSDDGESGKKFLLWKSVPGFNTEFAKDVETLSCENKKGDSWSDDKLTKTNAWCSLVGSSYEANDAKNAQKIIRRIVNRNDEIDGGKYEGNKELFDPRPNGLNTKISENGKYTLSIYPSVQEGMFKFMSDNNMIGSVFAYRPSNGDIYCMASTPGWMERTEDNHLKDGAQVNKNLFSFTPGATMQPITFLVMQDQGIDVNALRFSVKHEDVGWIGDSYYLEHGDSRAIHCAGYHGAKEQSASDGLGNSCNSFFGMSTEMLDLEKAQKTLESMDFYVEKYKGDPTEFLKHRNTIDKIPYRQSVFPLEETMTHSFRNVANFIGQGNLLVSPIDMAVLTALFGKLSSDKNSKVYFPRIWLPVDEKAQKDGSPELLLTEKNTAENEHIAKLSDFVSTHRESIAEVGRIWKKAYDEHYRVNNQTWPANRHLDRDGLTAWSQWIDMAKTGTVGYRPDMTHPRYKECKKFKCEKRDDTGKCVKESKKCSKYYDVPKNRKQRTLSLYSEELDLAAYIVVENYSNAHVTSIIKLDSTSLKLTQLVAEALGKKLDPEKQKIEDEQLYRFMNRYKRSQEDKNSEETGIETRKIDGLEWSELSKKKMFHLDAEEACSQLRAGGHEDWRLPTIDELRTLVQNHPGTVSDGKCRIFEKILLDSEDNCSENNILERVEKYLDNSCKGVDGKIFSKLGDTDVLWSYTAVCEPFRANIWGLDFSNGGISYYRGNGENEDALKFRCVRQDDADACETAKKYDISYYWEKYLKNYPNGKCAGEAKAFLKKWEEMFRDTVQDEIEKEKVK